MTMGLARNLANLRPSSGGLIEAGDLDTSATQLFGMRNLIINGAFNVWQRGTSFAASVASDGGYLADRFWIYADPTGTGTHERSTDVPDGQGFAYSFHNNSSIPIAFGTNVELTRQGASAPFVYGESYTLSFWVKGSSSGSATVASQYQNAHASGTDRVSISSTSFSITTSWTKITWTFTVNQNPHANNKILELEFSSMDAGFKITGMQLERGSVATPFEHRPYGTELAFCQRYYQYNLASTGYTNNSTQGRAIISGAVAMRATPTLVITSATGTWEDFGVSNRNLTGFAGSLFFASSVTSGGLVDVTYTSSSVGKPHGLTAGAISMSAEL